MSVETVGHLYESDEVRVRDMIEAVELFTADPVYARDLQDPVFAPYAAQVLNSLQHLTYGFRIDPASTDYPYELNGRQPYPERPTEHVLRRAEWFMHAMMQEYIEPTIIEFPDGYAEQAQAEQDKTVQRLLADPMGVYFEYASRREKDGDFAPFPELGWTVKALLHRAYTDPKVEQACDASPILLTHRAIMLERLASAADDGEFCYGPTVLLIEDAVAFFDLVVRVNDPSAPPTYHSARFEYNWHGLVDDKELTLLPTMASVTAMDLLKIRSVPVGLIGVFTDTMTVDGFPQTPYEFFHHDVDHTRRMHLEMMAAIERDGVEPRWYYQQATDLIHTKLLPAIDITGVTDTAEIDRRIAMRMTLFEVLHEDAYDPCPDTIGDAILREALERTCFERMSEDGRTVEYFMGPRASTLAHVYRKLAHNFYDSPDKRSKSLGSDFVRTRTAIVQGAFDLYRMVSDDPISDEALLTICRERVSSDEGFTDAFIGNLATDIQKRATGRRVLSLMVTRPMNVLAAVRTVRKSRERIHSIFGYSALDYEHPELLEQTIEHDLQAYDPAETAIAIGATPYGIGRVYPIAKDLGFYTLGIVSSTAVGRSEEAMDAVDEIVVVKDNEWGGYRYSNSEEGLLSPTTRAFVGASDSIAAYGGGKITAVTIEEMLRRGKPVTFTPFEMNHRIAEMMQAQSGRTGTIDYRGPAHSKWDELEAKHGR